MQPFQETEKGIHLFIRVTPNAKVTKIEGIETRADGRPVVKLRVKEVPDKGKANAAALALLAKFLSLPKSRLCVIAGATGRDKTVLLQGFDRATLDKVLDNLPCIS